MRTHFFHIHLHINILLSVHTKSNPQLEIIFTCKALLIKQLYNTSNIANLSSYSGKQTNKKSNARKLQN